MARTKVISAKEAAALIKDGDTVLVGGFMTNGTAKSIVNEVTAKDLTVVCNDAGFENEGTGRLLHNGLIKRLIATHVGLNKEVAAKFNAGEIELKLQPKSSLLPISIPSAFIASGIYMLIISFPFQRIASRLIVNFYLEALSFD